jgi:hypothetical protein
MDFKPFAFRLNENALSELVGGYVFEKEKRDPETFDYSELKDEQHRQALEAIFSESGSYGYGDPTKALKRGYTSIGCVYGDSKVGKLKTFLENKKKSYLSSVKKIFSSTHAWKS